MTPKQQRFVEEYMVDLNACAAAKRAGYSAKTSEWIGPQLLGKTHVKEAVQMGLEEKKIKSGISAEYVLERLKYEAELEGEGATHAARVRALELLGKHIGLFPANSRLEVSLPAFDTENTPEDRRIARRLILEEVKEMRNSSEE